MIWWGRVRAEIGNQFCQGSGLGGLCGPEIRCLPDLSMSIEQASRPSHYYIWNDKEKVITLPA